MKATKSNRTYLLSLGAAALLFTVSACNGGSDAKKAADSVNNAKADMTDSANKKMASATDSASGSEKKAYKDDAHFVTAALDGGAYEVAIGKVAQKHSADPKVKMFAEMMVKDHTKWGDGMKAYAKSKNITIPDSLSNDKKDKLKDIADKGADKFDVAYMDNMKKAHQDDLDAFKDAEKNTTDPKLKALLEKVIPGIERHLMHASVLDSVENNKK